MTAFPDCTDDPGPLTGVVAVLAISDHHACPSACWPQQRAIEAFDKEYVAQSPPPAWDSSGDAHFAELLREAVRRSRGAEDEMDAKLNGESVRHDARAGWAQISRELGFGAQPPAAPSLSAFERRLIKTLVVVHVVAATAVAIMRYRESRRAKTTGHH